MKAQRLKKLRDEAKKTRIPVMLHEGHGFAHLLYCVAVFFEGHGLYSIMGGVLAAIGFAMLVIGSEGDA